MHELQQDYDESLAIIAWHNGDEFSFPEGDARDNWYGITGYPTVWFDGWTPVVGGYTPSSYPYYVPVMEERVPYPSNFEVFMEITPAEGTDYNIAAQIDIKNGNSTENLAGFVVLTETEIPSPGSEDQKWVARNVWPDAMGMPLDFSVETSYNWNTVVTIEDDYVFENCEAIVFIQNMDTREIYQGTSLMMTEITTEFPPAANFTLELQGSDVVLTWEDPGSDGITGFNIYHAFDNGEFELLDFASENIFVHSDPEWGLHQYYVTAKYVSGESEPTEVLEVLLTGVTNPVSQQVSVYPNPASGRICIKSDSKIEHVDIINATGKVVYEIGSDSRILNLNTANLEAGLYLFVIQTASGHLTETVIIE